MLDETATPLVQVSNLKMYFPIYSGVMRLRSGEVKAVDGVSFDIYRGETLGLVGESGCGKSTIARAIVGLVPHQGQITIAGQTVGTMTAAARRRLSTYAQIVFQDPFASLDPKMTVGASIAEPLVVQGVPGANSDKVIDLLELVGLSADHAQGNISRPHFNLCHHQKSIGSSCRALVHQQGNDWQHIGHRRCRSHGDSAGDSGRRVWPGE